MLRCVVLVLLIGLASAQRREVEISDCGSKAEIKSIQIEPCDSDPCVLKRGETSNVHFSIVSDQDTETAELSGKFKAWFLWLPIPSFGHDMCDDILKCPIVKGQTCNGTMPVLISNYAVPMKTSVEFKIAGDKGTSVCFRTKVVIK
ncbi:mite group 2 allergen-like Ixo r 2 isoform X1 [Amblyomma americanum]